MAKSNTKSTVKPVAKPVFGAAIKSLSAVGDAFKKASKPLLPWKEMDDHSNRFLEMFRRNATLREIKSIEPMDGLILIALVAKIEQGDKKRALLAMQSSGGRKTAIQQKNGAMKRREEICKEARKLLKGGISMHNLSGRLVQKMGISRPTIDKALKAEGIKK